MADKVERWEPKRWAIGFNNKCSVYIEEDEYFVADFLAEEEAELTVALNNAAISINPSNPMAVAGGLERCIKSLGALLKMVEMQLLSQNERAIYGEGKKNLAAINKPATKT